MTLWSLLMVGGEIMLEPFLSQLGLYVGIITLGVLYTLMDYISRDSIDPRKLVVLSVLMTVLILVSLEPDSFYADTHLNGEMGVFVSSRVMIAGVALIYLTAVTFTYHALHMHRDAAPELKRYSRIGLLSSIILLVLFPMAAYLSLIDLVPGFWLFTLELGVLPIGYAISKDQRLAFILPFKALRLTVFETEGGVPLYTHTWAKDTDLAQEALFTGMLQGVGMILNESVKRGVVKEILLEGATLIIRRYKDVAIACALVATKATKSLRDALDEFAERFYEEFSQFFSDTSAVFRFATAAKLVDECFGFIPGSKI